MVAGAAVVALAGGTGEAYIPRDVLRGSTGRRLEISRAVSQLAAYRAMFTEAAQDQLLFSATGQDVPERIRLAVLDSYDGAVFRTGAGRDASSFVRVASARPAGAGERVDADIVAGALDGIWMPSAGARPAVFGWPGRRGSLPGWRPGRGCPVPVGAGGGSPRAKIWAGPRPTPPG